MSELAARPTAEQRLAKILLEAEREEYEELAVRWKLAETKAQAVVALAGVLIAITFAYAEHPLAGMGLSYRISLVVAIALLVGSVLCALMSLRITSVPSAPLGKYLTDVASALRESSPLATFAERLLEVPADQALQWRSVNVELDERIRGKVVWVSRAQNLLIFALVGVSALTILRIFGVV